MDVLKPELLYVKGRCYRINPVKVDLNSDNSSARKNCSEFRNYYEEVDCCPEYSGSDDDDDGCVIESLDRNYFRASFHVARTYFPLIIGSKGATRKRLETETKTQIVVPKLGQEGDIVVTGNKKNGILACYRRINLIVLTARRKQQYTHFISIPFCGEQIKKRFLDFKISPKKMEYLLTLKCMINGNKKLLIQREAFLKKDVLENCNDRGIEECVFQSPEKLHMTLCTMVLSDDFERNNAAQVLQKCKTDIIDTLLNLQPLKLRICGIEIMNDDPAEVNVVYGKVHCDDEELLQSLADGIVNYCAKAGIVEREYEKVKLHITLMNTSFRTRSSTDMTSENNRRNRIMINATSILKMFDKFDFGEQTITDLHLSQMGTVSNTGYYKASVTISLS